MPLLGEQVFAKRAWNQGTNIYTHSWEVNIPPRYALVKTWISEYFEYKPRSTGLAYISSIRRRLPNGSDEPQDFPDPYHSNDARQHFVDGSLSSVTYAIQVAGSSCKVMCVINYWG